jgi:hypothetical protein
MKLSRQDDAWWKEVLDLQKLVKFCITFTHNLCQNALGEISLHLFAKFRKTFVTFAK